MAMYKTLIKSKLFKPLMLIVIVVIALFIGLGLTSGHDSMKWLPGQVSVVYADDSSDETSSLFTPVMKDLSSEDWTKLVKSNKASVSKSGGTGSYWAKVNGVSNGFMGLTTGSSASFNYSNPSSMDNGSQVQATAKSALYMKVLNDNGLDHSVSGGGLSNMFTSMGRYIGGALLLIPLTIIAGADKMFTIALNIGDYLNIYKYLAGTATPSGILGPFYSAFKSLYTAFQSMGMVVTVIILGFAIWAYAMGFHQLNNGTKFGGLVTKILLRIFVIVAGPIVISMAFSSAITSLKGAYANDAGYKTVVMSSVVDFEGWAKHSRLALPSQLNNKISASTTSDNHVITAKDVYAINTDGAGNSGDANMGTTFKMITGWMTGDQYDAGQFMSNFQQRASDSYFTGKDHAKLKSVKSDDNVKSLISSGSLYVNSSGKFTNGSSVPKQNQNVTYNNSNGFGLSTVGMYNYLSSTSDSSGLQWTNLGKLANNTSKPAHMSYGISGRGAQFFANYLALFTSLAAIAYIAYMFAIRAFSAIFKGFFNTLVRFFTSAGSGSPIQLSKLVADFLSMLVQLFGGAFLYHVVSLFITTMNTNSSKILGAVITPHISGVLEASSWSNMTGQIITSVLTIVIVFFMVKYSGTFNKGVDEFLTQGIDRLMGKVGYDSQTANRNQGGLTNGTGIGSDGNAGTGGGMNNDGLSSNSSKLTNPDTGLGRFWNRKQDESDAMDAAGDPNDDSPENQANRKQALRQYRAGKAARKQLRNAGFDGMANDMENIAAAKRRDGDGHQSELEERSSDDQETPETKDANDVESNSPVLGGKGDTNVGDGSMDDLVDAQAVNDADKEAHTMPELDYDADGNPTPESVARQLAAANHIASDVPTSGTKMSPEKRKKILSEAGMKKPETDAEANDMVQTASDDLRTAQRELAVAKTPEEVKKASAKVSASSEALMAAQDEASEFNTAKASQETPGATIAESSAMASTLMKQDAVRHSASVEAQDSASKIQDTQMETARSLPKSAEKAEFEQAQGNVSRIEKSLAKQGQPVPKENQVLTQAHADFEGARQAMIAKGSTPQTKESLSQARGKLAKAEKQYIQSGDEKSLGKYNTARQEVLRLENGIIGGVKDKGAQQSYAKSRSNLEDVVSVAEANGQSVDMSSPLAQARVQQAVVGENLVKTHGSSTAQKSMTRLQNAQKLSLHKASVANSKIATVQQTAKDKGYSTKNIGNNGKLGNVQGLQNMTVERTTAVKSAQSGSIGAQSIAQNLNNMTPKQAVRAFNDMPETQKVMLNRAVSSGVVTVDDKVVVQSQKAMANKALKQNFNGTPLKVAHKQAQRVSILSQQFRSVEKDASLKPVEKNRALSKLRIESNNLKRELGPKTFKQMSSGKYRSKVNASYEQVVQNAKNGHDMNVSGNFKNKDLLASAAKQMSKKETRGNYVVSNNKIIGRRSISTKKS